MWSAEVRGLFVVLLLIICSGLADHGGKAVAFPGRSVRVVEVPRAHGSIPAPGSSPFCNKLHLVPGHLA